MTIHHPVTLIGNDIFARKIIEASSFDFIHVAVDIGAHTGESSTHCIFQGLEQKQIKKLYALEPQKEPFKKLCENYKNYSWVIPVNKMTGKFCDYNTPEEIKIFYDNHFGSLNRMPFNNVMNIVNEEIGYLKQEKVEEDGIDWIIKDNKGLPDLIMLDASSFTHTYEIEFPKYYGTKVIILDDTRCMKNMLIRTHLLNDKTYNCFFDNINYRYGVSIFIKEKSI